MPLCSAENARAIATTSLILISQAALSWRPRLYRIAYDLNYQRPTCLVEWPNSVSPQLDSRPVRAGINARLFSRLSMTTALVFPGQGSQSVGMGKALADAFPVARAVFGEVDDALGEK